MEYSYDEKEDKYELYDDDFDKIEVVERNEISNRYTFGINQLDENELNDIVKFLRKINDKNE